MKRKIHVRGAEDTGAAFEASYYGFVAVSPELAERMGAFRETAHEEDDIDSAYEVDRMLEEDWLREEQEAALRSQRRTTEKGGTLD